MGEAARAGAIGTESHGRRPPWLTRNVAALSLTDFFADSNYEMVLAVLPLFVTIALGAPALALGLIEGVADGSASAFRFMSGYSSDRISRRQRLGSAGYLVCAGGFGLLALVTQWPQVLGARAVAWIGRGTRQPIRSALLAQGVPKADMGKAFGLHEAADTLGAFVGPGIAFFLLVTGHSFTVIFLVAVIPGLLAFLSFSLLPRDQHNESRKPKPRWQPMPAPFWRLMVAVAAFGAGNFGALFFTLRAFEMLIPQASYGVATAAAVAFVLGVNAVGMLAAFPGGWFVDHVGVRPVLAAGYVLFAAACVVAAVGHGPYAVVLVAITLGLSQPLVTATEGTAVAGMVDEAHRGTAFGILAGLNGLGDLVSSVVVGLIWTFIGAPIALGYGALLAVTGAGLLVLIVPRQAAAAAA